MDSHALVKGYKEVVEFSVIESMTFVSVKLIKDLIDLLAEDLVISRHVGN